MVEICSQQLFCAELRRKDFVNCHNSSVSVFLYCAEKAIIYSETGYQILDTLGIFRYWDSRCV